MTLVGDAAEEFRIEEDLSESLKQLGGDWG